MIVVLGNIEDRDLAAVGFGRGPLGLIGGEVLGDLVQQDVRLFQVPGHIGDQHEGRFVLARLDQGHRHLARGHALEVVPGQADLAMLLIPLVGQLGFEIFDEGLHDRIGHQLANLRLVPLGPEVVDVADGNKTLGRGGQQALARRRGQQRTTQGQRRNPAIARERVRLRQSTTGLLEIFLAMIGGTRGAAGAGAMCLGNITNSDVAATHNSYRNKTDCDSDSTRLKPSRRRRSLGLRPPAVVHAPRRPTTNRTCDRGPGPASGSATKFTEPLKLSHFVRFLQT